MYWDGEMWDFGLKDVGDVVMKNAEMNFVQPIGRVTSGKNSIRCLEGCMSRDALRLVAHHYPNIEVSIAPHERPAGIALQGVMESEVLTELLDSDAIQWFDDCEDTQRRSIFLQYTNKRDRERRVG